MTAIESGTADKPTSAPTVAFAGGRRTVLPALARDPFWPTRRPINFARRVVNGRGRPTPLPPGPVGLPFVGAWPWFVRNPYSYLQQCADKYGDICRVPMPLYDLVLVNHPDHVTYFMSDPARYSTFEPFRAYFDRKGAALPFLEGEEFRHRRRLLAPMFGRRHLADISATVVEEFTANIDRWDQFADTGQVIDFQHEIAGVTLSAFLRAMFSGAVTEEEMRHLDVDLRMLMQVLSAAFLANLPPNPIPNPWVHSLPAAKKRTTATFDRMIAQRRAHPIEGTDLLGLILDARRDDGTALEDRDVRAELRTMISGGYETAVASLSWTLALLCANPEPTALLYEEVDALGGAVPTYEDLGRLGWAKACFDEGQRLQGAPLNFRFALDDDEIDGYPIPRMTMVGVSMYALHRDPRWWADPDQYDPTRFTDETVIAARPKNAFIPFGAGPHHCIGSALAYMNAQFLLALLFQRYRFRTPDGWTPRHAMTFSTTIKGGLPVTIERRA